MPRARQAQQRGHGLRWMNDDFYACLACSAVFRRNKHKQPTSSFTVISRGPETLYVILRLRWPSTEWETGPGKKGKKMENGPRLEMAEKWSPKWKNGSGSGSLATFFHFGGHFSAISSGGPFSICFPIFPRFLRRAGSQFLSGTGAIPPPSRYRV